MGIAGGILSCAGLYTLFTGDTTVQILGGKMIPEAATLSVQMNKEWAIPFLIVGLILLIGATALMKHRK